MPVYTTTTVGGVRVPTSATLIDEFGIAVKAMADDLCPDIVSTLPGSPVNGQQVYFQSAAMASNNMAPWHLRYRSASTSTYKWEPVGQGVLDNDVAASEGTNAVASADLTTVGPQVVVPLAGNYEVDFGAVIALEGAVGSPSSGTGTVTLEVGAGYAARQLWYDVDGLSAGNTIRSSAATSTVVIPAAGDTLKLRYYMAGGLQAAVFSDRWLRVRPLRVG